MGPLKIGVIGCGGIAQSVHLPLLSRLPQVQIVALAEADPERRAAAGQWARGASLFAGYPELLRESEAEAVLICLPNALHAEAAIASFENGRHVYLEKPVATALADARSVLSAWKSAGVTGMIGFNYRFNPLYVEARRQIASGRLGKLVGARSVFATSASNLPAWKRSRAGGGGVLLDLASHHLDLIRFFFDQEICAVSADLRSLRSEGDSAALQLRLSDGLLVQSLFSFRAIEEDRFEVYGEKGKLTVDRYASLDVEISDPIRRGARLKGWVKSAQSISHVPYMLQKLRAPGGEPSYRAALAHFVAAARSGCSPQPDLLDGCRSLAVIAAAEESAALERTVPAPIVIERFTRPVRGCSYRREEVEN
jgi:predicted dehydrogenase